MVNASQNQDQTQVKADYDPITLSLFSNRFMCIAEAMGRSLKQTAISTNIKERLDFSCAVFSPNGDLVANAPFVPVHLGAMSCHLPDLTVITPCFDENDPTKIIFFTASRGHHSDIGGILPGSMPPTSTQLYEEGANIQSLKIVSNGYYNHDALYKIMVEDPAQYPGCSGSRSFKDVESDIKAQIAANNKGTNLLKALVKEYNLKTVHSYMNHIKNNAERSVRKMLRKAAEKAGSNVLHTIAGGSGAGDGWHGTSGVHCHMTNTRITDPEILERRYPVLLHEFGFRSSSGGVGKYRGGEGCIRSLQFLQPLSVSILSERRARSPYGLKGGGPGATGLNLWVKQPKEENGKVRTINVGGKGTMQFGTGDRLILHTPGGGGWGAPDNKEEIDKEEAERLLNQARDWEPRGTWADKAQPDF
ncbi:uncharacterized protein L201_001264 [Kwoniella dendrophila CBS 6074]|uniref:Hydantoinase B/oxoprolinase domain-containing protein n=1 Tax=Kwoniella dendrophila CBS 6074 TaxID=1295534 RepID=A0AAX4JNB3_9TREE